MAISPLTPKQDRFCQKYIETGNASEAYRQSYDAENMAPETVHNEAHVLLKNREVAARIEGLQELQRKRHEVTVDRIVAEYAKLAFLDIRKAFDENGNLKPIAELDDDTAAALAGIDVDELFEGYGEDRAHVGRTRKIRFIDKKGALDSLMKFLGQFTDKVELTGKDGKPLAPSVIIADLQSKSLEEITRLFTERLKG